MISFQRTILPWTVFSLMAVSMLALWGNFLRDRKPAPRQEEETSQPESPITIVAQHLHSPWDLAFLPDGDLLVTELTGRLLRIGSTTASYQIPEVYALGEAGLLGITLHPDFESNQWIYLFFTTKADDHLSNQLVKYRLHGNELEKVLTIIDGIPASAFHNGGRVAFGPDEALYIATGDAGNASLAQDPHSWAGKILKTNSEGENIEIYSYGHRNPLGLCWDEDGNLWASEAGPQGKDKISLVLQGSNYGWPKGKLVRASAIDNPQSVSWGIGQIAHADGHLYVAGLRGNALYDIDLAVQPLETVVHLHHRFGRIRSVAFGPDGYLYLTTNNRDGRGQPQSDDDKLIKIDPKALPKNCD